MDSSNLYLYCICINYAANKGSVLIVLKNGDAMMSNWLNKLLFVIIIVNMFLVAVAYKIGCDKDKQEIISKFKPEFYVLIELQETGLLDKFDYVVFSTSLTLPDDSLKALHKHLERIMDKQYEKK